LYGITILERKFFADFLFSKKSCKKTGTRRSPGSGRLQNRESGSGVRTSGRGAVRSGEVRRSGGGVSNPASGSANRRGRGPFMGR
jgi:hypothetical protein